MGATYVETRDVRLSELTRYPGNARRGAVDKIRESLRRNGQYRALVVREVDDALVILAGNHTYDAIRAEEYTAARCEIIQCGDDDARRINLADNRMAELGTWDEQALAELLAYLDGDYVGTGYSEADAEMFTALSSSSPPSLENLAGTYGDPDLDDLWPVLRFKVPPNVRDDFYDLTKDCSDPNDDTIRFIHLLQTVRAMR